MTRSGLTIQSAKAGPDFIDPAFHAAATGKECINLDPWAMRPGYLRSLASDDTRMLVVEAMMGLFDGGADGSGSAADLAILLGLPVVLVVDASKQSHSIAALVHGFCTFRKDIEIAGVILNKVGSARHETMLREALDAQDVPVFGCIMRNDDLALPERHLGLVMAGEHQDLDRFLDGAADLIEQSVDMDLLIELHQEKPSDHLSNAAALLPPGQKIAIARDQAFAFCYPHLMNGWKSHGAELTFFSPLNDEAPTLDCDCVYLPGGYPELHAERLASNQNFKNGIGRAATNGAFVCGECGGYMVLGQGLIDREGKRHEMTGLLPLVTSFHNRKLSLGYRLAQPLSDLPFASKTTFLTTHEFHYSTIDRTGTANALFHAEDARGQDLGLCGMHIGNVAGSYLHVIDRR